MASPRLCFQACRLRQHLTPGQIQRLNHAVAGELFGIQITGSQTQEEATQGSFMSRATPRKLWSAASPSWALVTQTNSCFFKTRQNKKSKFQPQTVYLQLGYMGLALQPVLPRPLRPVG